MGGTRVKATSANGAFYYDKGAPLTSSGRKTLFRGTFRESGGNEHDAIIAIFKPEFHASYANELACLARNETLGVGPKLFATHAELPIGYEGFAIIEEYAGISLEDAVFHHASVPSQGANSVPLCEVGTRERTIEVEKIAFDVLVQLRNMHERGIYHRDLRLANVCVKRCGQSPEDIRATIVDFELSTESRDAEIAYDNEPYVHLFKELVGAQADAHRLYTPLEIDTGYFTALLFELTTGTVAPLATRSDLRDVYDDWPLFGYRLDGTVFSRMIDYEIDIEPHALNLGLKRLDEEAFPDPALFDLARETIRHGGFLDAYDISYLASRRPAARVYEFVPSLANNAYETYLSRVRKNGLPVEFETIGAQPEQLLDSTNAQVRDIPKKIHALGYSLASDDNGGEHRRVYEFSPDEIEFLAYLEHRRWCDERKAGGWKYGPEKDVNLRISDCLLPYEELPDQVKEYDREHAREIPAYLERIGLIITR